MRKVILAGTLLLAFSKQLFAEDIEVTKRNRGLFGYKSVTEVMGEGRHILNCSDPGRTRCRPNSGFAVGNDNEEISNSDFEKIDKLVEDEIISKQSTYGKIQFKNKLLIEYKYDPDTDLLVYVIMSFDKAKSKNLM